MKEMELVEEYLIKDKSSNHFRLAVATSLKGFNESSLNNIMSRLKISLSELCYINNSEAIKEAELLCNKADFGFRLGIGADIKTDGKLKESLGRLLIFLKRKMESLKTESLSNKNRAEDLRLDIKKLIRGEAEIVICSVCEGTGKQNSYDDDVERIICWNCEGDKKVIKTK